MEDVRNLLNNYTFPNIAISETDFWSGLMCVMNACPDTYIYHILKTERKIPRRFFFRKYVPLHEELKYFPSVRLVFTVTPVSLMSHRDGCPYVSLQPSVKILQDWIQESPINSEIYNLIRYNRRFYSSLNSNWLFVPFNMNIAMSLFKDINLLNQEK